MNFQYKRFVMNKRKNRLARRRERDIVDKLIKFERRKQKSINFKLNPQ